MVFQIFSKLALKFAICYLIFGVIWILSSDYYAKYLEVSFPIQSLKGVVYVLVTAFIFYQLLLYMGRQIDADLRNSRIIIEALEAMVVIISPDRKVKFINKSGLHLFNQSQKAVKGKDVLELLPQSMAYNFEQAIKQITETGQTQSFDTIDLFRYNSTPSDVDAMSFNLIPVKNKKGKLLEIIIHGINYTEKAKLKYNHAIMAEKYDLAMQSLGALFLTFDKEKKLVEFNPLANFVFDNELEKQPYPSLEELKLGGNKTFFQKEIYQVFRSKQSVRHKLLIKKHWYDVFIYPIQNKMQPENVEQAQVIMIDVSSTFDLYQNNQELERELQVIVKHLEQIHRYFEKGYFNTNTINAENHHWLIDIKTYLSVLFKKVNKKESLLLKDEVETWQTEWKAKAGAEIKFELNQTAIPFTTALLKEILDDVIYLLHANANTDDFRLMIRCTQEGPWIYLDVNDNSTGLAKENGTGLPLSLKIIEAKIEKAGGELMIESIAQTGNSLLIKFPVVA